MNRYRKFAFIITALLLVLADRSIAQQPVRLWSYAYYRTNNSSGVRLLIDTGRFYYSGLRGLTFDSSLEYFLYRVPTVWPNDKPDDYPNLTPWYTHRYHPLMPRVVAQFDSFKSLAYQALPSPAGLRPNYTTRKSYTAGRLDMLQINFDSYNNGATSLFEFAYDQAGRPETCRMVGSQTITLIRDSAGRVIRKEGEYQLGAVNSITTIYHHSTQGLLDSVIVGYPNISGSMAVTYRDVLKHDTFGRLCIVNHYGDNGPFYRYAARDSFVYDGMSNRYAGIFSNGSTVPSHAYTYDANGRLLSYTQGTNFIRTFQRNVAGYITEMTETQPNNPIVSKTYYYYDSLGAVGLNVPIATSPIEIYPNPATSVLNVRYEANTDQATLIHITDLSGRVELSARLRTGETSLNITQLPSGIYLWEVSDDGLTKARGKFVKQ